MNYNNPDLQQNVEFLHNAELLMDQRGLSKDAIAHIVASQRSLVLPPDATGVVVAEGIADNNKRVRVIISESEDSGGGSEDNPLVINTIVLGT